MTDSKITAKLFKQMQKEYVESGGQKCPVCDSYILDGHPMEPPEGDNMVTQKIECLHCHATWTDLYELKGFSGLKKKEDD